MNVTGQCKNFINGAQIWTALFRAFSFHQQPSAYLNQSYSPATSRPTWTNLKGLHNGRAIKVYSVWPKHGRGKSFGLDMLRAADES